MDDLIRSLPKLLRVAGEGQEVVEAAVMAVWRRVAGEQLRGQAVPFRLYQKTLIVHVADTMWQRQLEAVSGQLLFRLNSLLGQAMVTYIEFRVDQKTVQEARAALPHEPDRAEQEKQALATATASGQLSTATQAIHDDDLRRRFLVAAGSCINRHEKEA